LFLAAAHTDSPALKIRPEKELTSRGYVRAAVSGYGAPILSGWVDRPLGVAGSVAVRKGNELQRMLYASHEPIAIIPNLAIHLNRDINKGFEYNLHQHMPALLGLLPHALSKQSDEQFDELQRPVVISSFLDRLASELSVDPQEIVASDLRLYDPQPACVIDQKLFNGPRLDDLAGCAAILEAFIAVQAQAATQVACFFDAEEIGSMTRAGAQSSFLRDILTRITLATKGFGQDFYRALSCSIAVSVDASQAWHPAYPEKFDEFYTPILGKGIALKSDANMNYATDFHSHEIGCIACSKGRHCAAALYGACRYSAGKDNWANYCKQNWYSYC